MWAFPFFRGVQGSKEVCAQFSTCSDLSPVPSMCWQIADSLSYNGMDHLDSGSFKVASGSGTGGFLKNQTALGSGRIPMGIKNVILTN